MKSIEGLSGARSISVLETLPPRHRERAPHVRVPDTRADDQEIRTKQERDGLRHQLEELRVSMSTFAADSGRLLRISNGTVIDVAMRDEKAKRQAEQTHLREELRALEARLAALAKRPEGLFASRSAQKAWDDESYQLRESIVDARGKMQSNETWMQHVREDVTSLVSLPKEVLAAFSGTQVSGRDVVEALHTHMKMLQEKVSEVEQKITH